MAVEQQASSTRLILHELRYGDGGKLSSPGTKSRRHHSDRQSSGNPEIASVDSAGHLTTRDIPLPLARNLMALHESAAPESVKDFANTVYAAGLMDEFIADVVEPTLNPRGSPSYREAMRDPAKLKEAFYAASFLQNEEARECHVYSHDGHVVAMAQLGRFAGDIDDLSCTIANFVVSPKLDTSSQAAVLRHVASEANQKFGEASLLTPEPWASSYTTHGFKIEKLQPAKDPAYMVRCIWKK